MLCEKWTLDTNIKKQFSSLSCEKPADLYFIAMEAPMRCFLWSTYSQSLWDNFYYYKKYHSIWNQK